MTPRAITARDAGLNLIARINRWIIAGAVALSGLISVAAARSFHGHATTHASAVTSQPAPAPSAASAPAQAAPAPSAPAPVVSGGS
jgi:hypothetical protein